MFLCGTGVIIRNYTIMYYENASKLVLCLSFSVTETIPTFIVDSSKHKFHCYW